MYQSIDATLHSTPGVPQHFGGLPYNPNTFAGTWETPWRVLQQGKHYPTGKTKVEWAEAIAPSLTFAQNRPMITLAPLQPEHVGHFYRWIADPEVIEYSLSAFQTMTTAAQIDAWFARTLRDDSSLNRGIFTTDTQELIGYAGISGISRLNQSGEYFIFIGEKAHWGRGVGTEVTKQVLALGFTELHLNRIMLTVSEPNVGGVKAYAKAGFKLEGRLREACLRNGKFHDKLIMAVLKSEW